MMRQALAVALGVALLAGMGGHADAAKAKKKSAMNPTHVGLRGCTHFRPPWCTMINSGGKTYQLVWTTPPVPPVPANTHMRVTGQVTGMVGTCFAPVVTVSSWKADRLHCPK